MRCAYVTRQTGRPAKRRSALSIATYPEGAPRLYADQMLAAGMEAPEFTLPDQEERPVSLVAQRGHWVILWWYPKASTSG